MISQKQAIARRQKAARAKVELYDRMSEIRDFLGRSEKELLVALARDPDVMERRPGATTSVNQLELFTQVGGMSS